MLDLAVEHVVATAKNSKSNALDTTEADCNFGRGNIIDYMALLRGSLEEIEATAAEIILPNDPSEQLDKILTQLVEQMRQVKDYVLTFPSNPMLAGILGMLIGETKKLDDAKRPLFKFDERGAVEVKFIMEQFKKILVEEHAKPITLTGAKDSVNMEPSAVVDVILGLLNTAGVAAEVQFPKIPDAAILDVLRKCVPAVAELNLPKLELAELGALLPSVNIPGAGFAKLMPKSPDFWTMVMKAAKELGPHASRELVGEISWSIYAASQHVGRWWLYSPYENAVAVKSTMFGSIYNKTGKGSRKSTRNPGK